VVEPNIPLPVGDPDWYTVPRRPLRQTLLPPVHFSNDGAGNCRIDFGKVAFGYLQLELPVVADPSSADNPCLFPDFSRDPEDPASYDFTLTDEYIKAIYAAGTKVFYRLGVSIEHAVKKYEIVPPKDYDRWARICAGIIRHYNKGWADGFHYGIEYWEIWNVPENPPMWTGTKEEYFDLYVRTAKHLKALFPGIKVGGYAGADFMP